MKQRILIIDDEQDLCNIVAVNLELAGYDVDFSLSATDALKRDITVYQLIILDVMMPNMSGFEFARILKSDSLTSHIPIIFLTARSSEDDVLEGFDIGADDYIDKPFSVKELTARVKAVIGRNQQAAVSAENREVNDANPASSDIDIRIDTVSKTIKINGNDIIFTPTEFNLLSLLLNNRGQVFSRSDIIDRVWPEKVVVTDRTIDVNINRIRKKIGRYAKNLITRQGFGYCFVGD